MKRNLRERHFPYFPKIYDELEDIWKYGCREMLQVFFDHSPQTQPLGYITKFSSQTISELMLL